MDNISTLKSLSFSQALSQSLVRVGGYENHEDKAILLQLISIIDERLKLGHACVPIVELESVYRLENVIEKIPMFSALIGNATEQKPLVYFNDSLAFLNAFMTEKIIADSIKKQQKMTLPINDNILNKIDLSGLDVWQKLAVISVNCSSFSVLTGGAGTGKTTTLTKILEWVLEENIDANIVLAAPTGKAAKRLEESIHQQAENLSNLAEEIKVKLKKLEVKTLHQLIGVSAKTGRAYRSENKPLICDFMAIDEASMVGSHLFVQTLNAILPTTKLLLLGDEQQLPAINTPSFFNTFSQLVEQFTPKFMAEMLNKIPSDYWQEFNDIQAEIMQGEVNRGIIKLKKSFRFGEESLIYRYAQTTLNKDLSSLVNTLEANQQLYGLDDYLDKLWQQIPSDTSEIRAYLNHSIILCAQREGNFSTRKINQFLDEKLHQKLKPEQDNEFKYKDWYVGRRIIIEENNYSMNVFNGDIGECVLNAENDLVIDFGQTVLLIDELPKKYHLAFAISIHKSQGSEYNKVSIVLGERVSPLLSRSLLYTAITRAKQSVNLYSTMVVLDYCLRMDDKKQSNLIALL